MSRCFKEIPYLMTVLDSQSEEILQLLAEKTKTKMEATSEWKL